MNTGIFGEGFPYSNFHDLNMDWIIKIAKDFLDQYTSIQQLIDEGKADITALTEESEASLNELAQTLEGLLNQWYETHSEDIAEELSDALADISSALSTALADFTTGANQRAQQAIQSIPSDYTALYNQVNNDAILVTDAYASYDALPSDYRDANNLPVNRVIGFKFGWTEEQASTMSHFPVTPFSGEIITINSTKNNVSFGFQLAINESAPNSGIANKLYFRSRYSAWTDWIEVYIPTQISNLITSMGLTVADAYTSYASLPSDYRNADNLPINSVIGYKFGWTTEQTATMSHFPVTPFSGEIITINSTKSNLSFGFQLAINESAPNSGIANKLYFRSRYSAWTNWVEVTNSSNIEDQLAGNAILVKSAYTSYSNLPSDYRNTNNLPVNSVIGYKFGWTDEQASTMSNFPVTPFSGEIMTINSTKNNASFGFQLAINEAQPSSGLHDRLFFRSRYTYWTTWVEITNPTYQNGAFRGFGNFIACGDSLTVSYSYTDETHYVQVKSWANILADMMGATAVVKAQGGITSGGFLSSALMTEAEADTSKFAIVYLGTNDANQQVSASTFKSNYTDIVNRLLTNHGFVLCIPLAPATSPSTRETYNTAIKEVCENVPGAFYLDMSTLQNQFSGFVRQGHLNSLGYSAFANAVAQAMGFLIAQHPLMVY